MIGDTMYNSTREYIKICILKLMKQCDISISDVEQCIKEIKDGDYTWQNR
jgi:hypothetical protein